MLTCGLLIPLLIRTYSIRPSMFWRDHIWLACLLLPTKHSETPLKKAPALRGNNAASAVKQANFFCDWKLSYDSAAPQASIKAEHKSETQQHSALERIVINHSGTSRWCSFACRTGAAGSSSQQKLRAERSKSRKRSLYPTGT